LGVGRDANDLTPEKTALFMNLIEAKTGPIFWSDTGEGKDQRMKYGRCEGGPEEDGCHKLEDTCTQKRRLEDGREGGQGPTRTEEPWSSGSIATISNGVFSGIQLCEFVSNTLQTVFTIR